MYILNDWINSKASKIFKMWNVFIDWLKHEVKSEMHVKLNFCHFHTQM